MALDSDDMRAIIMFSSIAVATVIGMLTGSWISNRTVELESCKTDLNKSTALYARCDERSIHFGRLAELHASYIEAINEAVITWETQAKNIGNLTKGLTSKLEVSNAVIKDSVSELRDQVNTAMKGHITKELQTLQQAIKDMNNTSIIRVDGLLNHTDGLAANISKRLGSVLNHHQESTTALREHLNGRINEMTTQSLRTYEALKQYYMLQTDELKISLSGLAKITEEEKVAILKALKDPIIKESSDAQAVDRKYQPDYPMLTLIIFNIFLVLYYIRKTDGRNVAVRHQHAA